MAQTNPSCYHLSASSIGAFKACPTLFRLAYREGIRPVEDSETLRIGTNWHAIHEVYRNAVTSWTGDNEGTADEYAMQQVVDHLNERYAKKPQSKDLVDWEREQQTLLTCFVAYLWYYQEDEITYLSQELKFDLPIRHPRVGADLPLEDIVRVGKIDHIVRWNNVVGPIERKSTVRDIAPGSDYWRKGAKDTQVSMYALALRDMVDRGQVELDLLPDDVLGNTIYDVWRRPLTKPTKLSQKDTQAFLETGTYYGNQYIVKFDGETFTVDGDEAELILGAEPKPAKPTKKNPNPEPKPRPFAIRETVSMYCARLLSDICEAPERYFQRKEIARTTEDLKRFESTLYNIYTAQKMFSKSGCWFENENQCQATYPCRYIPICYGPGADAVCDGETTPTGFKRIFVDMTVDNAPLSDDGE